MNGPALAALLAAALAGIGRTAPPEPAAEAPRAPEPSAAEVRKRVEAFLGSIDTPIRPSQWQALGPGAVPVLMEIATSPDRFPPHRARAVDGLAALGGAEAQRTVLAVARSEREFAVRAAALRGAGRLLPPDELLPVLRPVLEAAGPARDRAVAAEVLARHGGEAGCAAVRARLSREDPEEREAFHHARAACEKR
jgi:hypothetical protein